MAINSRFNKKQKIAAINITPMVDVMLVLLVIMMVSAKYIVAQSYQIELPKVASQGESVSSNVEVIITSEGEYVVDDAPLKDDAALNAYLADASSRASDVNLIVRADVQARHGSVVHVIDLAKQNGIFKFAINVQRD